MAEKYAYITFEERQLIEEMLAAGARVLDIALQLGKHTNVIYNELHRGQFETEDGTFGYSAKKAQAKIEKSLHARGWRRDVEKQAAARKRELENRRLGIRTRKAPAAKKKPVNISVKIAKPAKETAPAAPAPPQTIETRSKDTAAAVHKLQTAAAGATENDRWWVKHIIQSFNIL